MNAQTKRNTLQLFFQAKPCLAAHVHALLNNSTDYDKNNDIASCYQQQLLSLCDSSTFAVVSSGVRARILAALHITSQHDTLRKVLTHCEATDITKALLLLDRPRTLRQYLKRIQCIENAHPNLVISGESLPTGMKADEDNNNNSDDEDATKVEISTANKKKRKSRRKIDLYRSKYRAIQKELHDEAKTFSSEQVPQSKSSSSSSSLSAVQEMIQSSSVSGSLAEKVRGWAKTSLQSDFLEFVMLAMPKASWQTMANIVHFGPNDFSVPYFLADVYGEEIAKDSFVAQMREVVKEVTAAIDDDDKVCASGQDQHRNLTKSLFFKLAQDFPQQVYLAYPFIRTQKGFLSHPDIVEDLAARVPLETAIWYFEELYSVSHKCKDILYERMHGTDDIHRRSGSAKKSKAVYGKLVERILTFRRMGLKDLADKLVPIADARLTELKKLWTKKKKHATTPSTTTSGSKEEDSAKVAVFGDKSYSMMAAIEAATIFSSMVSTCFDAELSFFDHRMYPSPHSKPKNVTETLEVCSKVRADHSTSLAAALWPYYEKKKYMDMFVLVTDEEENTSYNGFKFASLLAKYKEAVNENVALIVVCVGSGDMQFRATLKTYNIEHQTVLIDGTRPDLAKFDVLLGQLALLSSSTATTTITDEENVPSDSLNEGREEEAASSTDAEFVLV